MHRGERLASRSRATAFSFGLRHFSFSFYTTLISFSNDLDKNVERASARAKIENESSVAFKGSMGYGCIENDRDDDKRIRFEPNLTSVRKSKYKWKVNFLKYAECKQGKVEEKLEKHPAGTHRNNRWKKGDESCVNFEDFFFQFDGLGYFGHIPCEENLRGW